MAGMPGGLTDVKEGDEASQKAADAVRSRIDAQMGGANSIVSFKVVQYKTQVVAGTNFFLKIQIAPEKYIHVKVFRDLQGHYQLTGLDQNKTQQDPIDFHIQKVE